MRLGEDGLYRAETIEEHMHPDVVWFVDPVFDRIWEAITGEIAMSEAAHTNEGLNPGFVNVQRSAEGDFQITVRGDPTGDVMGPLAQVRISEDDFYQLIAQVQRLQPAKLMSEGEIDRAETTVGEEPDEELAEGEKIGAGDGDDDDVGGEADEDRDELDDTAR